MKYFVWVQGLRGPEPQIWDEKTKTQEGKPVRSTPLICMLDNDERSIEQLAKDYPYG